MPPGLRISDDRVSLTGFPCPASGLSPKARAICSLARGRQVNSTEFRDIGAIYVEGRAILAVRGCYDRTILRRRTLAVVFGAAVRPSGDASPALARRTGYAAAIAEADPNVDLFLSGGIGAFPPSEAAAMAAILEGYVSAERLILDEVSTDTLQTVRAATAYALAHGYAAVLACTDAYHQPRVRMLFWLMGLPSQPVPIAARGRQRLRMKMWLRECAAIPYDLFAGCAARWRDRR